jgi:hypothetical protein
LADGWIRWPDERFLLSDVALQDRILVSVIAGSLSQKWRAYLQDKHAVKHPLNLRLV